MKTFASLFTGFGGTDIGAKAAGLTPAWGIEYRADIAGVANANLGGHVQVADVLKCDPRRFDRVDVLHASPPCPNFSVAKKDRGETEHDLAMARKVAEFVTVLLPDVFTLENVIAYRDSQSWKLIETVLWATGYWLQVEHVNAADFGVPQTRRRMIVRAVRGGWVPYLPPPVPWVGWYAAIEDILDTLPESQFAPWQLARLPEVIDGSFFTVAQQSDDKTGSEFGYGCPRRSPNDPAFTVTTQTPAWFKAFLLTDAYGQPNSVDERSAQRVPGGEPMPTVTPNTAGRARVFLLDSKQMNQKFGKLYRSDDEPSFTVISDGKPSHAPRAFLVAKSADKFGDGLRWQDEPAQTQGANDHGARPWLRTGLVVAMTPRALARFQTFPDWYELPTKKSLAALGIGNAVPPLLYQRIAEIFNI